MFKKFYGLAWLLLVGAVAVSIYTGSLSELAMVGFGLIALGMVYALVLWSVLIGSGSHQT